MATNTYTALATQVVTGSAASSVTFTGISGSYTDLYLVQSSRLNTAAHTTMTFNGITTNYSSTVLYGTGSAAGSGRYANASSIQYGAVDEQGAASTYNVAQWHIMNYANTTTYKTVLINVANPLAERTVGVGMYRGTPAAVTSITLTPTNSAQYQVGSTFTLYGI